MLIGLCRLDIFDFTNCYCALKLAILLLDTSLTVKWCHAVFRAASVGRPFISKTVVWPPRPGACRDEGGRGRWLCWW